MAEIKVNSALLVPLTTNSVLFPGALLSLATSDKDLLSVASKSIANNKRVSSPKASSNAIVNKSDPLVFVPVKAVVSDVQSSADQEPSFYNYGTLGRVIRVGRKTASDKVYLLVEGIQRVKIDKVIQTHPRREANVTLLPDTGVDHEKIPTLVSQLKTSSKELLSILSSSTGVSSLILRRLNAYIENSTIAEAGLLADLLASGMDGPFDQKLAVLEANDLVSRLNHTLELIQNQIDTMKAANETMGVKMNKRQREYILRQQLKAIQNELGESSATASNAASEGDEIGQLRKKLIDLDLPPEPAKIVQQDLKRIQRMQPNQAEYQVCRTYLETLTEIPWHQATVEKLDSHSVERCQATLDADHYGLKTVKKRLIEYVAVLRLQQISHEEEEKEAHSAVQKDDNKAENSLEAEAVSTDSSKQNSIIPEPHRQAHRAPIILLVGPPGVGKTSVAKSIASSLGRKFYRISLGGVRDEAEIRGHRRTYVGAMPGLVIQAMRQVGVINPVILLDEIDKLASGSSFHGDPSAAMLEVLDPEQNHSFKDHYLGFPYDLSKILFMATANTLETIPPALLDRMEVIQLAGYTYDEKVTIAQQYLVPKQIRASGMKPNSIEISPDILRTIATGYTREAGVRNLEREIAAVCRGKAVEYSSYLDSVIKDTKYSPVVTPLQLEKFLGIEKYENEMVDRSSCNSISTRLGIVSGLAYMGSGNGGILVIEATSMPGNGKLQLTGQLGEVIRESAQLSLSWTKSNAMQLGLTDKPDTNIVDNIDIHIHAPAGGIPKDGPSAGITITTALVSLLSQVPVDPTLAMTGEMTLRGRVLPVGGIKEKVLGAHRAGIKTIIMPERNRKDVQQDLPQIVKDDIHFIFVRDIWQVLNAAFPERRIGTGSADSHNFKLESHL